MVGEVVIDGTPARAVTGTVRLPRQADRAGMTFNSLRTLSWPNVGNSLSGHPCRISGLQDAVRRTERSEAHMTARRRPHHHQSGMPRPRPATTDDQPKGR